MSRRDRPAKKWLGIQPGLHSSAVGGGGVSTYSISGDATEDGTLVTLTGDASDSQTTSGDGLYEFTGLDAGTYTVTPTLDGYLFTPESAEITIVDANDTGNDFSAIATWPVLYNFEGDTITETGTELIAKSTHYDMRTTGVVRADDYSTLEAIWDSRLDNCFASPGQTSPWVKAKVPSGGGFVPSDGGQLLMEAIINFSGSGAEAGLYIRSADDNEGFAAQLYANGNIYLREVHGGVWTGWKIGPVLLDAGVMSNPRWFLWQVRYRYDNYQLHSRAVDLHAETPNFDSGWNYIGTNTVPTYSTSTEHTTFTATGINTTDALVGVAQFRVADYAVDGVADGVAGTHNYRAPS